MYLADSNTLIYAAKRPEGEISRWLSLVGPFVTDVSYWECLLNWPQVDAPEFANERAALNSFFENAATDERIIHTVRSPTIIERAAALTGARNIRQKDALIAAAAEFHGFVLVTADVTRNFAPRLAKLTAEGNGVFRVRAYDFEDREAAFAKWNAEVDRGV